MTLNNSLIHWLSTFDSDINGCNNIKSSDDLADGLICAQVLHQIAPQYFDNDWIKRIIPVTPDGNWRLRVSNLKRIVQKIQDYTNDVLGHQFTSDVVLPDVVVIAQNFDQDQIVRLLQLILCCAVNCDKKQTYINKILALPLRVQHDVMTAIQELLPRDANSLSSQSANNELNNQSPSTAAMSNKTSKIEDNSQVKSVNRSHQSYTGGSANRNIASHSHDFINQKHNSNMTDKALTAELRRVIQDLKTANTLKDEKAQACYELELKLEQLQLERDQLMIENERLSSFGGKKIKDDFAGGTSHKSTTSKNHIITDTIHQQSLLTDSLLLETSENQNTAIKFSRLQNQIQTLNDKLFKAETSKEEYRLKANLLQEDLDDLNRKHANLLKIADQAHRLQDELDEHKHLLEKVAAYESMIENYSEKLADSKKNIKALEEKNISHVKRNVELEEENKRISSINSQLDKYKRQIQDLQLKLSQESHRADKAECELSRLDEKYELLKSENDRLIKDNRQFNGALRSIEEKKASRLSDLGILPTNNDNLPLTKTISVNKDDLNSETAEEGEPSSLSMTNVANNIKEKLVRLEHENQLLHKKLNSDLENNHTILEALLEEANRRCSSLENENRNVKRQNLLLESRLKSVLSTHSATTSNNSSQLEVQQKIVDGDQYALQLKIEELQALLNVRDQELSKAEYRYKRNLQKAKQAVKALEQQTNNLNVSSMLQSSISSTSSFVPSLEDCNILKQQVNERDRRIAELEREFSEIKKLKEIHERLILNALHSQGASKQWSPAENPLSDTNLSSIQNIPASSSFESRQHNS